MHLFRVRVTLDVIFYFFSIFLKFLNPPPPPLYYFKIRHCFRLWAIIYPSLVLTLLSFVWSDFSALIREITSFVPISGVDLFTGIRPVTQHLTSIGEHLVLDILRNPGVRENTWVWLKYGHRIGWSPRSSIFLRGAHTCYDFSLAVRFFCLRRVRRSWAFYNMMRCSHQEASQTRMAVWKKQKCFFPIHVWKSVLWGASVTER